jgi:hypothetical protein
MKLSLFRRGKVRECPISRLEIPPGQANCPLRDFHYPRLCVVCAEELSDAALRCNRCDSPQTTWRRFVSSEFKWLTILFLVIGNLYAAGSFLSDRHSYTSIKMVRANEQRIYLKAWNTGKKPSALTDFSLCFPPGMGINTTVLEPATGDSVVPPNGSIEIALRVANDLCRSRKRGSTERYTKEEVVAGLEARRSRPLTVRLGVMVEESGHAWDLAAHPTFVRKGDTFAETRIKEFIEAVLPEAEDPSQLNCSWCVDGCPTLGSDLCSVDR